MSVAFFDKNKTKRGITDYRSFQIKIRNFLLGVEMSSFRLFITYGFQSGKEDITLDDDSIILKLIRRGIIFNDRRRNIGFNHGSLVRQREADNFVKKIDCFIRQYCYCPVSYTHL